MVDYMLFHVEFHTNCIPKLWVKVIAQKSLRLFIWMLKCIEFWLPHDCHHSDYHHKISNEARPLKTKVYKGTVHKLYVSTFNQTWASESINAINLGQATFFDMIFFPFTAPAESFWRHKNFSSLAYIQWVNSICPRFFWIACDIWRFLLKTK